MDLNTYLEEKQISRPVFAEEIGVTVQALGRYLNGQRRPEWEVLKAIKKVTNGEVTADDFLEPANET